MSPALHDMLAAYRPQTPTDYQNATRELVQEIALLGLWRGGFFDHATTEVRTQLLPSPYQVTLYDLGSLFSGKLHAVLCRGWKNRIKGRDFYDFVWYVGRKVRPNLEHLDARMRQSGHWDGEMITGPILNRLLRERFAEVDIALAADEVRVFLPDPRELDLWSKPFFNELAGRLK